MSPEERAQLTELLEFKRNLERSSSIPLAVDQAFRERFKTSLVTSAKGATTENQAVNEGGAATYNVLKSPDGFLQVQIGTTVYYLPYFL